MRLPALATWRRRRRLSVALELSGATRQSFAIARGYQTDLYARLSTNSILVLNSKRVKHNQQVKRVLTYGACACSQTVLGVKSPVYRRAVLIQCVWVDWCPANIGGTAPAGTVQAVHAHQALDPPAYTGSPKGTSVFGLYVER